MALGFAWIFIWSVLGGLLGAQVNRIAASAETSWLQSWQRMLLRTAHAHMNSMGVILVLMGLVSLRVASSQNRKILNLALNCALVGIPIFGFGLLCEAYNAPTASGMSLAAGITVAGGCLYLASLALWTLLLLSKRGLQKE